MSSTRGLFFGPKTGSRASGSPPAVQVTSGCLSKSTEDIFSDITTLFTAEKDARYYAMPVWIPAFAGMTRSMDLCHPWFFVIPAKAGIHAHAGSVAPIFRRNRTQRRWI